LLLVEVVVDMVTELVVVVDLDGKMILTLQVLQVLQ
jgi:hypothetical protein